MYKSFKYGVLLCYKLLTDIENTIIYTSMDKDILVLNGYY